MLRLFGRSRGAEAPSSQAVVAAFDAAGRGRCSNRGEHMLAADGGAGEEIDLTAAAAGFFQAHPQCMQGVKAGPPPVTGNSQPSDQSDRRRDHAGPGDAFDPTAPDI